MEVFRELLCLGLACHPCQLSSDSSGWCVLRLTSDCLHLLCSLEQSASLLYVGAEPSHGELLKSEDLLQKASEIEKQQKEKVARAAIKLEKEEEKERAVSSLWSRILISSNSNLSLTIAFQIEAQAAKLRQEAASRAQQV